MSVDDFESRKLISFDQAEGIVPLPTQLDRKTLTNVLRARLADLYTDFIDRHEPSDSFNIRDPAYSIMRNYHIKVLGEMPSKYSAHVDANRKYIEHIFTAGQYNIPYGFIQYSIRQKGTVKLVDKITEILEQEHSAYRIIDGDTLVPISSEVELRSIVEALRMTSESSINGANKHIKQAAVLLSEGQFADSIRESIHAVESTARTLEPSADALSKALAKLEGSINIHSSMKLGFNKLYGYTSDEKGIRHPLLNDADTNADETDAVFMIGACSSFVGYLIGKARKAGVLK